MVLLLSANQIHQLYANKTQERKPLSVEARADASFLCSHAHNQPAAQDIAQVVGKVAIEARTNTGGGVPPVTPEDKLKYARVNWDQLQATKGALQEKVRSVSSDGKSSKRKKNNNESLPKKNSRQ
jgi:hypothetical protein